MTDRPTLTTKRSAILAKITASGATSDSPIRQHGADFRAALWLYENNLLGMVTNGFFPLSSTPTQTLTDTVAFYATRLTEWALACRTEVRHPTHDGCMGVETVRSTGRTSYNLGYMLARASELNATDDPAGTWIVVDNGGTEIEAPAIWTGYVVTIEMAGDVMPVAVEMDLDTAKRRASTWRNLGARLRSHTFAGDSYYAYSRLADDCQTCCDRLDARA